MVFRANVTSVLVSAVWVALVELHLCLGASSVSGDSVLCHFGKGGSHPFDFLEA